MTTTIKVSHRAAGDAVVPLSYLPHAERRGWSASGPVDVPPAEMTATMPNRSATKSDWTAYATDVGGMAGDVAEDYTRDRLADLFDPSDNDG